MLRGGQRSMLVHNLQYILFDDVDKECKGANLSPAGGTPGGGFRPDFPPPGNFFAIFSLTKLAISIIFHKQSGKIE